MHLPNSPEKKKKKKKLPAHFLKSNNGEIKQSLIDKGGKWKT